MDSQFQIQIIWIVSAVAVGIFFAWAVYLLVYARIKERRSDKEREQLSAKLAAKNNELEQIIHITSHDLRSPLVNIQGFSKELGYSIEGLASILEGVEVRESTNLQIRAFLENEIPEALQYISASVAKMDSLLAGLLKLSHLGTVVIEIEKLDMNSLINNIVRAFEYQIKDAGVEVGISELPACMGDKTQINQVFSNLFDNALKYFSPNRRGTIEVSGFMEDEKSIYCVEDNGIGIAPENQEKVFRIFHQLNPDTSTGEGLGLAIVSRIIDKHHGSIRLESEIGKGSRFFVELPAA